MESTARNTQEHGPEALHYPAQLVMVTSDRRRTYLGQVLNASAMEKRCRQVANEWEAPLGSLFSWHQDEGTITVHPTAGPRGTEERERVDWHVQWLRQRVQQLQQEVVELVEKAEKSPEEEARFYGATEEVELWERALAQAEARGAHQPDQLLDRMVADFQAKGVPAPRAIEAAMNGHFLD